MSSLRSAFAASFASVRAPIFNGFVPEKILRRQLEHIRKGSSCSYYKDLSTEARQKALLELRQGLEHTLRISEHYHGADPKFRRFRSVAEEPVPGVGTYVPGQKPGQPECFVYTCGESSSVPGKVVLNDWDEETQAKDKDAPQLRRWMQAYLGWLKDRAGLNSIDNNGYDLHFSVHYGRKYNNAFWDGKQMVTGDGDGVLFNPLHLDPTVSDHEIEHGATEFDAGVEYKGSKRKGGLDYSGESGGINEHYSDAAAIFAGVARSGKSVEQMTRADWLIGAIAMVGNNRDGQKSALRSFLKEIAYDRDDIGRDSQIKHYKDYRGQDVHDTSGISNHALYLAAQKIGGNINETLAPIWAKARRKLHATATFREHYLATVEAANELFPDRPEIAKSIADAWKEVGVNVGAFTRMWYGMRSRAIQMSEILLGQSGEKKT